MASLMEALNASQTSIPHSIHAIVPPTPTGLMSKTLENFGISGILLSLLAMAVAYDQSECGTFEGCVNVANDSASILLATEEQPCRRPIQDPFCRAFLRQRKPNIREILHQMVIWRPVLRQCVP